MHHCTSCIKVYRGDHSRTKDVHFVWVLVQNTADNHLTMISAGLVTVVDFFLLHNTDTR